MRAETLGRPERHPGSNAVDPRFVRGGGGYASSVRVAADDNRLADEAGISHLLDRHIEGVEIDVQDGARG